jgi:hypothetical protein
MNWKGCGRKRSWHNVRYYPVFYLDRLKKTTPKKNLEYSGFQTGHLPNTSQKHYYFSQFVQCKKMKTISSSYGGNNDRPARIKIKYIC